MHTGCRYCILAPITIRTSIFPSFEQGKLLQIMYLGINLIVKLLLVENKMELQLLSSMKFLINKTCIDVQSYCYNRLEKKYCRAWILEKISIIRQLQLCSLLPGWLLKRQSAGPKSFWSIPWYHIGLDGQENVLIHTHTHSQKKKLQMFIMIFYFSSEVGALDSQYWKSHLFWSFNLYFYLFFAFHFPIMNFFSILVTKLNQKNNCFFLLNFSNEMLLFSAAYYLSQNAGDIARKYINDPELLSFIDTEVIYFEFNSLINFVYLMVFWVLKEGPAIS